MGIDTQGRSDFSPPAAGRRGIVLDAARGLAAAGVLLSADVHLDLWDLQRYRQIHIIGALFLLNVVAGLALGIAVLVWRHWLPSLAAAGFGAATLAAFWLSVTVGLFAFKEKATGSAQVLAEAAEIVAIVCGLAAATLSRPRSKRPLAPPAPGTAAP
jgi:hypothetical protein